MYEVKHIERKVLATVVVGHLLVVCAWAEPLAFLPGSGTESDPFLIGSVEELVLFAESVNSGDSTYNGIGVSVALTSDLDLGGFVFEGIGDFDVPYMGDFDGRGHTVRNMIVVLDDRDCAGFIRELCYGSLSNLNFKNISFDVDSEYCEYYQSYFPERDFFCFSGVAAGSVEYAEVRDISVTGFFRVGNEGFHSVVVGDPLDSVVYNCNIDVYRTVESHEFESEVFYDDIYELPDPNECIARVYFELCGKYPSFKDVSLEAFTWWIDSGIADVGEEVSMAEFVDTPRIFDAYAFNVPYDTFASDSAKPGIQIVSFEKYAKGDSGNAVDIVVNVKSGEEVVPVSVINCDVYVRYGSSLASLRNQEQEQVVARENIGYGDDGSVMLRVDPPAGDAGNIFYQVLIK